MNNLRFAILLAVVFCCITTWAAEFRVIHSLSNPEFNGQIGLVFPKTIKGKHVVKVKIFNPKDCKVSGYEPLIISPGNLKELKPKDQKISGEKALIFADSLKEILSYPDIDDDDIRLQINTIGAHIFLDYGINGIRRVLGHWKNEDTASGLLLSGFWAEALKLEIKDFAPRSLARRWTTELLSSGVEVTSGDTSMVVVAVLEKNN